MGSGKPKSGLTPQEQVALEQSWMEFQDRTHLIGAIIVRIDSLLEGDPNAMILAKQALSLIYFECLSRKAAREKTIAKSTDIPEVAYRRIVNGSIDQLFDKDLNLIDQNFERDYDKDNWIEDQDGDQILEGPTYDKLDNYPTPNAERV